MLVHLEITVHLVALDSNVPVHLVTIEGGAIHAALFLKHFVREGVRWAHLDIAGVDWATKKTALCPVGSTGFGARTLLELARGGV